MSRAQVDARDIRRAAASIIAVYLDASELTRAAGAKWYSEEAERCEFFACRYGRPAHCVAGAAAAISPGMRWSAVFAHLAALLQNRAHKVPTYNREFVRRALYCLDGGEPMAVLSGPKVTAFYKLLARLDLDAVVVDGHAWNICTHDVVVFRQRPGYAPPAASRISPRRYRIAAEAYRQVAADVGASPHAVQAATWLHWREQIKPMFR